MTPMNALMVVVLALLASSGFWAFMTLIVTRKGRIAEVAQADAKTEQLKASIATSDIERRKLMAEVESVALASADRRYEHLRDDYDEVRGDCKDLRAVIVTLVDVLDVLVFRMRAAPDSHDQITLMVSSQEFLTARAALNEARTHLR